MASMEVFEVNGFRVLYKHNNSDIVNARIIVNAGSSSELTKDEFGAAHFLEHMFFKGTEKRDYKEINKITSRLGSVNASTSHDKTAYYISFLSDDWKEAVGILLEMVFQSSFPEEEFQKERGVILEEYVGVTDQAVSYYFRNLFQDALGDDYHWVIGTKDSIENMTLDHLKAFKNKYYTNSNMILAVCGNIDIDNLLSYLGELLPHGDSSYVETPNPIEFNPSELNLTHHTQQAIMGFTFEGISSLENIRLNYAADVFSGCLGGAMHSVLFNRLREELGLCYTTGAIHRAWYNTGLFSIYVLLDQANIQQATSEIASILDKIKNYGFEKDIIEITKKNLLFELASTYETTEGYNNIANGYFSTDGALLTYEEKKEKINNITNQHMMEFAIAVIKNHKYAKMIKG